MTWGQRRSEVPTSAAFPPPPQPTAALVASRISRWGYAYVCTSRPSRNCLARIPSSVTCHSLGGLAAPIYPRLNTQPELRGFRLGLHSCSAPNRIYFHHSVFGGSYTEGLDKPLWGAVNLRGKRGVWGMIPATVNFRGRTDKDWLKPQEACFIGYRRTWVF
jgi:hypothetical protein